MRLAEVLAPGDPQTFAETYLERRFVVVAGAPDRYGPLVPWSRLNQALNEFRLPPGSNRVRLVRDGSEIPAKDYLQSHPAWGSSIHTGALERQLADGATLVVNGVHELFEEIRELADDMSSTWKVGGWANLYAGWRTQRGFDLHWDDHETVILQVHGRKAWKVWGPTCEAPVKECKFSHATPTAPPVWEGILEAGSLLYMPRGWWHVAVPLDEPTLHVTMGLRTLKGSDVLAWLTRELAAHPIFRKDAPVRGSQVEQGAYISALRSAIGDVLSEPCLESVRQFVEACAPSMPPLDLPRAVTSPPALRRDAILLLSGTRGIETTVLPTGQLSIVTKCGSWTCSAELKHALARLSGIDGRRVEEICAGLDPILTTELKCLLTTMHLQGALVIRNPSETPARFVYSVAG